MEGVRPDLIYIDGCHDYDYVFVDFFLSDQLLRPGAVLAINDCAWPSVFRVIQFLRKHRNYRELDVGLPKAYRSRNPAFTLVKRIRGMSRFDRYFEKKDD